MALVKSLAEIHGGKVSAYSEGIGKGSRFTICLPHLKEQIEISTSEEMAQVDGAPANALKVMVVDDNEDVAQMMSMLIEALGHRVVVEHSSKRALERA